MGQPDESGQGATAAAEAKPEAGIEPAAGADAAPEKSRFSFLAARPRLSRITILAVAMALSAAAGSTVGAMAAAALAKPQPATSDDARTIEVNALRGVITQLSADVAALKASIDGNARSADAQMAKLLDRVERAEKAQGDPSARIARIAEALERLEKKSFALAASSETTGSIGPGSVAPKQQDRPPVIAGWVLRDVFDGRAMVENGRLGYFEVVPGANLPGIGRVETIRRVDGRWAVVTPKGLIVSAR